MLNGKWEYYCIKSELEMSFNVVERGAASEMVKWKMGLSCRSLFWHCCSGKQVNFGLEISMKETNYLISLQHLPFIHLCHSDLFPSQNWTEGHRTYNNNNNNNSLY
jgi:hypothetical protein